LEADDKTESNRASDAVARTRFRRAWEWTEGMLIDYRMQALRIVVP
jgi:hypothetical protein